MSVSSGLLGVLAAFHFQVASSSRKVTLEAAAEQSAAAMPLDSSRRSCLSSTQVFSVSLADSTQPGGPVTSALEAPRPFEG